MKNLLSNKYFRSGFFIITGIFLGWLFFHSPSLKENKSTGSRELKPSVWTCAMHPQIRKPEPGKCPLCGMELIPVGKNPQQEDPEIIHMTLEAAALANITTTKVSRQNPVKEIRLYGKVQTDERLIQSQVSHISGRIEKLMVNFTGETVKKGQTLTLIYSPELITSQQELLEAFKSRNSSPEIYEAAKARLQQWKISDAQIEQITSSGKIQNQVEIGANTNGVVISRRVNIGDYVNRGSVLYEIADLSKVWVLFDAYESDIPYIHTGDHIIFTVQSIPGKTFTGNIGFIDPVVDPISRVVKLRLEINNPSGVLKPEMFGTGILNARLQDSGSNLVIPASAVLWTGKRSIVYVKSPGNEPIFKLREIELGPSLGNNYILKKGLTEGEEIVSQGAFNIDAAAQLEGKPSMMNPVKKDSIITSGVKTSPKNDNSPPEARIISAGSKKIQTEYREAHFKVYGNCDLCKERIETVVKALPGVSSADWNISTKILNLKYNPLIIQTGRIHKAVAMAGHDTEKEKAPDAVYQSLPECCLYRQK